MTRLAFDARGYWHLEEVLDAVTTSPRERRRVSRWLSQAEVVAETPTGGKVVVRTLLEERLPWLLDTLRRIDALDDHTVPCGTVTTTVRSR
jgi:hypothetical protein